jgi:hypothetical protein
MKRYKLIQTYPNSPKLNSIAYFGNHGLSGLCYQVKDTEIHRFDKITVESNPKFWEKIEDYEILSFSSYHLNQIVFFKGEKTIRFSGYFSDFTREDLLSNNNFKIHSVKRFRDNRVFTLEDKISVTGETFSTVNKFSLKDGTLYVNKVDLMEVNFHKKLLFTTNDNIKIFEGEPYVEVEEEPFKIVYINSASENRPINSPVFSTSKAGREYMSNFKKCISIKDLITLNTSSDPDKLKIKVEDLRSEVVKI